MKWDTDWLEGRCRINPDDEAIVDGEQDLRWTFLDLNKRAMALANTLINMGVQKGDRIALLAPNHISYFDLLFACGKIGAVFVPLNYRLSAAELSYIIHNCEPSLLCYHHTMASMASKLPCKRQLDTSDKNYEMLLSSIEHEDFEVIVEPSDELAMIYTGGTTGKPKGVVLSHRSIYWNAINTVLSWHLSNEDVTLTYLPMFHTGGLNALSLPILMAGGKVVIGRKFNPEHCMQLLNQEKCTIVLLVPTMHHLVVNSEAFQNATFPTMRTFLSGGASCPFAIYEAYKSKEIAFKEGYGLTEAGPNNFYIHPQEAMKKVGSVGRPMMLNHVKVIKESGDETSADEVGELLIQGHHVFNYYWKNETATQESLRNGWLYTGDLAKRDKEGYYYILGRKKEMIITGGENVFPLEVENLLSEHPAISEVTVLGLPDDKWGEIVSAFVVLKEGEALSSDDLKAYCSEKIGGFKIPKIIKFLEELPKTDVGKINKKALKEVYCNQK